MILDGPWLPNGSGWSPDVKIFYLIDSYSKVLFAYTFDLDSGVISRPLSLVEFPSAGGLPDGLAVDESGNIWVAMWGEGRVLKIDPLGRISRVIHLPVEQPTPGVAAALGVTRDDPMSSQRAQLGGHARHLDQRTHSSRNTVLRYLNREYWSDRRVDHDTLATTRHRPAKSGNGVPSEGWERSSRPPLDKFTHILVSVPRQFR